MITSNDECTMYQVTAISEHDVETHTTQQLRILTVPQWYAISE